MFASCKQFGHVNCISLKRSYLAGRIVFLYLRKSCCRNQQVRILLLMYCLKVTKTKDNFDVLLFFFCCCQEQFLLQKFSLLGKQLKFAATIGIFYNFQIKKKNSFRGNYSRKSGMEKHSEILLDATFGIPKNF